MQLRTLSGDTLYNVTYTAKLSVYDRYLPVVLKIIDSISIKNGGATPSLAKVKEYALHWINLERNKHGLSAVQLSSNEAAQEHAEDAFKARQMSHLTTSGK